MRPEVIDLPYGTPRHNQVLEAVKQRYMLSHEHMSKRYDAWKKQEERVLAYVNLKETDEARKQLRKQGRPQYVTLDVPYSHAMLLTAHTYWTSVFLGRSPVLQYSGRHGQTQDQEAAVEALMDYQYNAAQMAGPLYVWLYDTGKYGLGVVANNWVEEMITSTQVKDEQVMYFGIPIPGKTKKVKQTLRIPKYKGNKIFNIRPQDFFPDPRVPISRLQEGEFCGYMRDTSWNAMLRMQQDGYFYNINTVRSKIIAQRAEYRDRGSEQMLLPAEMDTLYVRSGGASADKNEANKPFMQLLIMVIEIVPKDWGLGSSPYPEKYLFVVANNEVIVCCMPTGSMHQKFEFFPLEYEIDGYQLTKRSMLELVDPLNETLTWLVNSHMYNVRSVMNDQFLIDPSRVVMADLTDPVAGRHIRLKPEAYGTNPAEAVHQLQVNDITRNNIGDAGVVTDLMQRLLGVTDNVQGMLNQGGRRTATEVRTTSTFGINRLKTNAEYFSATGWGAWAITMLQNTQQRYDAEQEFKIAGSLGQSLAMRVTPDMIAGEFNFAAVDGTMPIDRFAQASLWKELMQVSGSIPQVAQQLDWFRMIKHVGELMNIRNFDRFRINVVPDVQAQNAAQQGNVVPLNTGGTNGRAGRTSGVPDAPRVAGVGPTG